MFYFGFFSKILVVNSCLVNKVDFLINDSILLHSDIKKELKLVCDIAFRNNRIIPNRNILNNLIQKEFLMEKIIFQKLKQKNFNFLNKKQILGFKKYILKKNSLIFHESNKNLLMFNLHKKYLNNYWKYYFYRIKQMYKIFLFQKEILLPKIHIIKEEIDKTYQEFFRNNRIKKDLIVNIFFFKTPLQYNDKQKKEIKLITNKIFDDLKMNFNLKSIKFFDNSQKNNYLLYKNISLNYIKNMKFKILENIYKKIKKGSVIGPIKSKNGIYLIKVNHIYSKIKNINKKFFHIKQILIKHRIYSGNKNSFYIIKKIFNKIKNKFFTFEELSKKFSENLYVFNKDGDLGWIDKKTIKMNFSPFVLKHLNKNNLVTKPVYSKLGWSLFKFSENKNCNISKEIYRNKIYEIILNQKLLDFCKNWIIKCYKNSYIKKIN